MIIFFEEVKMSDIVEVKAMKVLQIFSFFLLMTMLTNAQNINTLIADGTADLPVKYALQPVVKDIPIEEIEAVKKEALGKDIDFNSERKAMSSVESDFKNDFELLDVAEGFFISREIKYRAYLYTVWSDKLKRNYQGIMVLRHYKNHLGEKKSDVAAHYVYEFRGDKYLCQLPDINGNVLSEIAVFSEPPTKKIEKRYVRIIEFSPTGVNQIGLFETYSRESRPNYIPKDPKQKQRVQMPLIYGTKLFVESNLGKQPVFYTEKFTKFSSWMKSGDLKSVQLEADKTNYLELTKPKFLKGPGEK